MRLEPAGRRPSAPARPVRPRPDQGWSPHRELPLRSHRARRWHPRSSSGQPWPTGLRTTVRNRRGLRSPPGWQRSGSPCWSGAVLAWSRSPRAVAFCSSGDRRPGERRRSCGPSVPPQLPRSSTCSAPACWPVSTRIGRSCGSRSVARPPCGVSSLVRRPSSTWGGRQPPRSVRWASGRASTSSEPRRPRSTPRNGGERRRPRRWPLAPRRFAAGHGSVPRPKPAARPYGSPSPWCSVSFQPSCSWLSSRRWPERSACSRHDGRASARMVTT